MAFPGPIFTKLTNAQRILNTLLMPNFSKIEQVWKVRTEINLLSSVKYVFRCADFHQTHNHSVYFYIPTPYRIIQIR